VVTLDALDRPVTPDEQVEVPDVPVDWTLRGWLWYPVEHEVTTRRSSPSPGSGVIPPFFALRSPGVHPAFAADDTYAR
jgi:hypothetical protein